MRRHYNMLKWIAILILAAPPIAADIHSEHLPELVNALKESTKVEFYFVYGVSQHGTSIDGIIDKASIVLHRSCGANCDKFMEDVLATISESVPFECEPGHEDLVIRFNSYDLLFRHSSRVVEINDKCFRSDTGIRDIIQSRQFIFGR